MLSRNAPVMALSEYAHDSTSYICNFIQRDAQHLFVFSLTGLFDKKNGPHWLVISNIESIEIRNDELIVHSNNDRQLSVSIPGSQAQLHAYVSRILTATEKHTIVFR